MKLLILAVILVLNSTLALADKFQSKVHSLIYSDGQRPHILRLENGRAVFIHDDHISTFTQKSNSDSWFEISTNDDNVATVIKNIHHKDVPSPSMSFINIAPTEPTIIPSMTDANAIFNRLNPDYQRISECTNRAHVWAYEEFKNHGFVSTKTFVYFTANYIWENHFIWWFHVAPTFTVNINGSLTPLVFDYRYMNRPVPIKDWTDLFVYSKRPCVVTTKFSEYDHNPHTEHCYLMYSNMYYWNPNDFKNEEATGFIKSDWSMGEVRASYSEAF